MNRNTGNGVAALAAAATTSDVHELNNSIQFTLSGELTKQQQEQHQQQHHPLLPLVAKAATAINVDL